MARPPGTWVLAMRWLRRNAVAAVGLAVLGLIAGVAAVFTPFAILPKSTLILLPAGTSPLNPLAGLNAAQHVPVVRFGFIATSAILLFSLGWLVQWLIRPNVMRQSIGAGAVVGLIATLVNFAFLGPFAASLSPAFSSLRLHPVAYYEEIFQRGD